MASSIRSGNFYSVWPILDGKPLNLQWGEERSNTAETKSLVRGSFQDIQDGADSLNALRALIGLAFGKQGFDNKYRLMFDKVTDRFCAQKNDGTEAVPIWEDVWCIRLSDGQFQVTSEGGIQSNAGFYGPLPHDLLAIGEILTSGALGGTQFKNPNELYFNTNGFYLTSVTSGPRAGKPIVNFTFPLGKSNTFSKTGKEWVINHAYNTTPIMVQAMTDGDVVIIPDKIDVSDPNTAYFYFNEVTSGKALLSSGGLGAVELISALAVTDGTNSYVSVEDLNFSGAAFYLSSDLQGSPVVNLSAIDIGLSDHGTLLGLANDDHPQYAFADGTRDITGHQRFDDSINVENSVVAEAFYLDGADLSMSGADLLISTSLGEVKITDDVLIRPAVGPGLLKLSADASSFWWSEIDFLIADTLRWRQRVGNSASLLFQDVVENTSPVTFSPTMPDHVLFLEGSGKVGLGTNLPTDKLHVAGRGRFDDRVVAEAFYISSGGGNWNDSSLDVLNNGTATINLDGENGTVRSEINFASRGVTNFALQSSGIGEFLLTDLSDVVTIPFAVENNVPNFTCFLASEGYLGVGTATPADKLHVAGRGRFDDRIVAEAFYLEPGSGGGLFKRGNDVVLDSSSGNVILDGNRVGIGTAAPTDKLHVAGRGRFDDQVVAEAFYLAGGGDWSIREGLTVSSRVPAGTVNILGGDGLIRGQITFRTDNEDQWEFRSANSGSFSLASLNGADTVPFVVKRNAPSNFITLHESGHLGVGTNLPKDKIHVAGRGRFDDRVIAEAFYIASGGNWSDSGLGVGTDSPSTLVHLTGSDARLRIANSTDPDSYLEFDDASTSQATITKTAAVGTAILDLSPIPSDLAGQAKIRFFRATNTSGLRLLELFVGDGTSSLETRFAVGGADSFIHALNGGNLGIGTTSPVDKLHVAGGITADDRIVAEAFYIASGGNWSDSGLGVGTDSPSTLVHLTGSDARLRIADSTDPASYLEFDDASTSQGRIDKITSSGEADLDLNPNPGDGSSIARLRAFRATNTSGTVQMDLHRGDGTGSVDIRLGVNGVNSFFNSPGAKFGIGTAIPTDKLHVAGRGRFDDRIVAEAFYLEPGSGGGLFKRGNDVVLSSADGGLVLEGAASTDSRLAWTFGDSPAPFVNLTMPDSSSIDKQLQIDMRLSVRRALLMTQTTPAEITTPVFSNYPLPTGDSSAPVVRLSGSSISPILGSLSIVGPHENDIYYLVNVGSFYIGLDHEGAGTSFNRIITPTGKLIKIQPNETARVWYDEISDRWRVLSSTSDVN